MPRYRLGPLVGLIDFGDEPAAPPSDSTPAVVAPVEVQLGDVQDYRQIPVIVPPLEPGQEPLARVHVAYPLKAAVDEAGDQAETADWYMSGEHPLASVDAPGPDGGTVIPALAEPLYSPRFAQVVLEEADPAPEAPEAPAS